MDIPEHLTISRRDLLIVGAGSSATVGAFEAASAAAVTITQVVSVSSCQRRFKFEPGRVANF